MNDPISRVAITLDSSGHGVVSVNGEDISGKLDAVQLIAESNTAPRIMLHQRADVDIHVDGIVQTMGDAFPIIESFLSSVNPDELEDKAISHGGAIPVAFLEVLKEMAKTWQAST